MSSSAPSQHPLGDTHRVTMHVQEEKEDREGSSFSRLENIKLYLDMAHGGDHDGAQESIKEQLATVNNDTPDASASLIHTVEIDDSRVAPVSPAPLDSWLVSDDVMKNSKPSKAVHKFYQEQNKLVNEYREALTLHRQPTAREREEKAGADLKQEGAVKFAIESSLAITFVLISLKLFAAIWSGSIAVIASAVDSALDIISQGTLLLTSRFMHKRDALRYPIGKSRVESLSVLVFGTIMGLAALFLLYQSSLVLVNGLESTPEAIRVDAITISIICVSIGIQVFMTIYCRAVVSKGGRNVMAVQALADDHLNDVLVSGLGAVCAIIASHQSSVWMLDPVGGILIAIYIFMRWFSECLEQFQSLLGKSTDKTFLSKITFLAMNHDERIRKIDTVLAYQLGTKLHVEVHVVLDAQMTLRVGHDIGESLEQLIEKLEEVELAWVHLDWEWQHSAEHDRWNL